MKTIGLIGGMSWESSKLYYEIVNEKIKEKLGGLHSAKCIMYSFDFEEIKELQYNGQWEEATKLMVEVALKLERAGADLIVICTNTMHISADEIQTSIHIPLLHIADATAEEIQRDKIKKIGLLGTHFTMEKDFYKGRLKDRFKLEVIVPNAEDKEIIHNVIYDELVIGVVKESSKEKYIEIINHLVTRGAEGIILGCTEIALLIKPEDVNVPLYDTTAIHATKAVEAVLK